MTDKVSDLQPEGRLWLLVIFVLVLFGGALVYFSRNSPDLVGFDQARLNNRLSPARQARLYTVFYDTGVFSPTNIRIHAGDSIKFQNDSNQSIHIVSDSINDLPDLVGFDSIGDIPPDSSFTYTFARTGTFGYHNIGNKAERGAVIVRP